MKRFAILSLMAAMAAMAQAAPLSPQQAQARLQGSAPGARYASAPLELAYTGKETATPAYYVFSGNNGYVIASADDLAAPVLGYVDGAGTFSYDALPPQMQWWLSEYARQIEAARQAPQGRYAAAPRPVRQRISPIVHTRWNQSNPYNLYCPVIGSSTAPTGCVATAMAQIVNHHKFPVTGRGTNTYTYQGITSSFDFGATTFDWANMTDTYDANSTDAQKKAVATLMRACGVAVNMMYRASSSGAYSRDVTPALIRHFRYSRSSQYLERGCFGLYEWEDTVYGSLKRNHPVYYAGSGTGGGHAFVVDGYNADGYFHLNWGWGGSSDGYFLLTALDPGTLGIGGGSGGFNNGQSAIIDLVPEYAGEKPFRGISFSNPYTMALSGRSLRVTGFGGNAGYDTIPRVYYGVRLTGEGGKSYEAFGTNTSNLKPFYGFNSFSVSLPTGIDDGLYTITIINRLTLSDGSNTVIDAMVPPMVRGRYSVNVVGGSYLLTDNDPAKVSVENFALTTPLFQGSNFGFKADYVNSGTAEFYKKLYFGWFDAADNFLGIGDAMPTDLQAGETLHLDIAAKVPGTVTSGSGEYTLKTGTPYKLAIVTEADNSTSSNPVYKILSDKVDVTIQPSQNSIRLSASNFAVTNSQTVNSDNITFTMNLKATAGHFTNNILFWVRELQGSEYVSRYNNSTPIMVVPEGQTKAVSHTFSCPGLEKDKTYQLILNYKGEDNKNRYLAATNFKVTTTGVEFIGTDADALTLTADGDMAIASAPEAIVSVAVYDIQGRRMDAPVCIDGTTATADLSGLPAGVYVVRAATAKGAATLRMLKK